MSTLNNIFNKVIKKNNNNIIYIRGEFEKRLRINKNFQKVAQKKVSL